MFNITAIITSLIGLVVRKIKLKPICAKDYSPCAEFQPDIFELSVEWGKMRLHWNELLV